MGGDCAGVGWAHSQYCKTFSGTLRLGVRGHAPPTERVLTRVCECGAEAFSVCSPGLQASGQSGEMGAQDSLGTVSHRAPEPLPQMPIGQIQATKQ